MKTDKQLIDELGGPTNVARLLGFELVKGPQRVQNWKIRGIPSKIRLQYLDLFGHIQSQKVSVQTCSLEGTS